MGGVQWSDRYHCNAQYCLRSEGESSLVETATDGDHFDDRAIDLDRRGAGVDCGWWTHCRGARERLRVRPCFSHSLENHSVAGGAWLHDPRVCTDLLLRA